MFKSQGSKPNTSSCRPHSVIPRPRTKLVSGLMRDKLRPESRTLFSPWVLHRKPYTLYRTRPTDTSFLVPLLRGRRGRIKHENFEYPPAIALYHLYYLFTPTVQLAVNLNFIIYWPWRAGRTGNYELRSYIPSSTF
jgi:hypothetical protein